MNPSGSFPVGIRRGVTQIRRSTAIVVTLGGIAVAVAAVLLFWWANEYVPEELVVRVAIPIVGAAAVFGMASLSHSEGGRRSLAGLMDPEGFAGCRAGLEGARLY